VVERTAAKLNKKGLIIVSIIRGKHHQGRHGNIYAVQGGAEKLPDGGFLKVFKSPVSE
jgi:hypothetical protein